MSFGDLEYQETTSNQLARLLKSMRQEQVILDAVQNPIDDVEEYPDARLLESQTGTKDRLGAVAHSKTKAWTLPSEPSPSTKLWLWFREGWRVKDHSCKGNEVFAEQVEPSPYFVSNYVPLRRKHEGDVEGDGATEGRLYGTINGLSQYYRVKDAPTNRITDLLETNEDITFSIFFSPFEDYIVNSTLVATTQFTKIDDDQIQNAVRVDVSEAGALIYSVVYKGNSYQLTTAPDAVPVLDPGEFVEEEFDSTEFKVGGGTPHQFDVDVNPPDWTWLFFSFNKTSRIQRIIKVASGGYTATEIATSAPHDETGFRTTFGMHIPANEGTGGVLSAANGEDSMTAYDVINSNHAVFSSPTVAAANAPAYLTASGPLNFTGDTKRAIIANHSSINGLSIFTIAFKIRPTSYSTTTAADYVITRGNGGNGGGTTAIGGFKFYMPGNGSTDFVFAFKPDSNPPTTQILTASNAIFALNQWYDVLLTYDGATYTLEVGGVIITVVGGETVETPTGTTVTLPRTGDVFTNAEGTYLGDTLSAFQGDIAHIIIDKGTVWNAAKISWFKNKLKPGFKAGFPSWKPVKPPEPAEPVPVVRPQSKVYEIPFIDASSQVKVNNPAATSPFVREYNVPGGTASSTPEELKYDVADGTVGSSTTNPIVEIYNLAPVSSTGTIQNTERAYVQRIKSTLSNLYHKKPTFFSFYVDSDGNADGTVYCCIFRNNGTYTKIGAGIAASTLGSGWVLIERSDYNDRPQLELDDGVGIVWENNNSGQVKVRRGGQFNHDDESSDGSTQYSWQHGHDGSTWVSNNPDFSIAGIVKTGGETVQGANPYYQMDLTNWAISNYQNNSTLENIQPSRIIWRARRVGSAASATVVCRIRNASGALLYTYPQTFSFNSIGTTVQNLEFIDTDNTVQWQDGYRINLEFDVLTGINDTANYLEVNYNVGPSNAGVIGGTAIKAQYYRGNVLTGYADVSPAGTDWAGKIYIGGAAFTAYKNLDNTCTRVGEKVAQSTSPNISKLFGDKLSKWNVTMKKEGAPTGQIKVKCFNGSGAEAAVFNTILEAEALTTTDSTYVFLYPTNNFVMDLNSRIVVEYLNGTATDKVLVKINKDATVGAEADGTKSILTSFKNGAWVDESLLDVSGEIFTGGIPDQVSRPRIAIRCDSIFSILMQDKITRAQLSFKKLGTPTGTYYIRTVRGSDNSNRDLLGSGLIQDLSTTAWTVKDVSNFNAIHYMGVSDKVVVEFEGGDIDNCLLVQVRKDSTYDDTDTRYEEYDGVNWNKDGFETYDIRATLWTGGDTYTPDPGTPYVEPPDWYDHDLLIGAGAFIKGGFDSFYGMRLRDFRIFTEQWSLEEINTVFENRYSKRGAKGSLALTGYFTLTGETEPPT